MRTKLIIAAVGVGLVMTAVAAQAHHAFSSEFDVKKPIKNELEAIAIESTHVVEIDRFVPRTEIDQRFLDTPYYVMPHEPFGQEAFAVIREAMRGRSLVALGRLVLAKRERAQYGLL